MVIAAQLLVSLVVGALFILILRIFDAAIARPRRLRSAIVKQGIRGPVPSNLYGNIPEIKRIAESQKPMEKKSAQKMVHDWFPVVFPHLEQWRNEYGFVLIPHFSVMSLIIATVKLQ